ncbi:MAG: tRNA 4-thiouridine(8) synthase ThiI [Clostridia bacterium]|nr:tRNA 4-thiouridine(8) synthase ThiI [Clostridia bacterium]
MYNVILVRYGEIALKGNNRAKFEKKLVDNIKDALRGEKVKIQISQARVYIEPEEPEFLDRIMEKTRRVFGIVSISPAVKIDSDYDLIKKTAVQLMEEENLNETFKVEARRGDKSFPKDSMEIAKEVGGYILSKIKGLRVDVTKPETLLTIEVREKTYIYIEKIPALGGMPVGTNGKALLLVSGGIDSPVAGYMLARRGVEIDALHFFSPPYTGPKAREKVIDLCKILAGYCKKVNLYIANFTEPQLAIRDNCPADQMVLLMRRIMMRVAERVAAAKGCDALLTGENIGQVASQTMKSIVATNDVCSIPVFRPLIGLDKNDIIDIAKKIGTYETSILPYEDCCTIFVPKHPETQPKIEKLKKSEEHLAIEEIVETVVNNLERIEILGN